MSTTGTRFPEHETSDLPPRLIVLAALALAVLVLVVSAGALVLVALSEREVEDPPGVPGAPALQFVSPERVELAEAPTPIPQGQAVAEWLNSLGWINRERGIARIPIEDAMRLLAERGWRDEEQPRGAAP